MRVVQKLPIGQRTRQKSERLPLRGKNTLAMGFSALNAVRDVRTRTVANRVIGACRLKASQGSHFPLALSRACMPATPEQTAYFSHAKEFALLARTQIPRLGLRSARLSSEAKRNDHPQGKALLRLAYLRLIDLHYICQTFLFPTDSSWTGTHETQPHEMRDACTNWTHPVCLICVGTSINCDHQMGADGLPERWSQSVPRDSCVVNR